jgi:hypothetical protein
MLAAVLVSYLEECMDPETVDQSYAQLQQQAQQTVTLIQTLAAKLQTAASAGDQNAREWMLDLREITVGFQQEQGQTSLLLQSIHAMIDNHVQTTGAVVQPQYQQPQAQQPQYQQAGLMGGMGGMGAGGGMLQRFLGGGMGRAIATGAGFGIGDEIIQSIF